MLFPEAMMDAIADRSACRTLLRDGSRTFYAASHLLPRDARDAATALYAFCRVADDAIDVHAGPTPDARRAALERLRARLDRVYRGQPLPQPADRAFAAVVTTHAIPRDLPAALFEGLAWDVERRRYETLDDLHDYAARVAGSVGVMMALIMGVREREALACAAALGAAMQMTNIARDIGEDARAGRLYLPLSWMREAGLDPDAWLAAPRFDPAMAALTRRLLDEAARLYAMADHGIAALPRACRPGIRSARLLYAAIGDALLRRGGNSVDARARVPAAVKAVLLARAMLPMGPRTTGGAELGATAFLIACVSAPARLPRRSPSDTIVWVIDLFARIEQRRARDVVRRSEAV